MKKKKDHWMTDGRAWGRTLGKMVGDFADATVQTSAHLATGHRVKGPELAALIKHIQKGKW